LKSKPQLEERREKTEAAEFAAGRKEEII